MDARPAVRAVRLDDGERRGDGAIFNGEAEPGAGEADDSTEVQAEPVPGIRGLQDDLVVVAIGRRNYQAGGR